MRITFEVPGLVEPPPSPIDVTPQPPPDYSRPALPSPPERRRNPDFGWIEDQPAPPKPPKPNDWMT